MDISDRKYNSGPDFELDKKKALIDINPSDLTELWLIQFPLNQLQPADFNGQKVKLKERDDDNFVAEFESLSGKSYEVIMSSDKKVDATACVAPGNFQKISRTVRLVHYPEPKEFEKARGFGTINLSAQKAASSMRRTTSKYTTPIKNSVSKSSHGPEVLAPKSEQGSIGPSNSKKKKKKQEGTNESETSGSKSEHSNLEKKKRKVKVEED